MRKIYFASGIVCAALFSACSDFDFDEHHGVFKSEEYDANFEEMIGGEVHPAQDWGFETYGTRTRGSNAGDGYVGNSTWEKFNADELENIEDDERRAVLEAIAKKVTGEKISEDIVFPWENYYLQDVINFQEKNDNYNGADFPNAGMYGMPDVSVHCLEAFAKGDDCSPYWHHGDDYANYVEVTNSKQMNQYFQKVLADGQQERITNTTLMTDMTVGTYEEMKGRQFRVYQNCHITGHYDDYITVQVNGSWYVCFDFGCGDAEHDVDGQSGRGATYNDWDYNDWIIKITEAVPHDGEKTPVWGETPDDGGDDGDGEDDENGDEEDEVRCARRIFGEDLGSTGDFDFNDVVFDAYIYYSGKVKIVLLAAGGTLPLYIGPGTAHEVHKEFGVPMDCMVNTGLNQPQDTVTFWLYPEDNNGTPYIKPKDIQISVDHEPFRYVLKAETGEVPQKIAAPIGTPWCYEYKNINLGYTKFNDWATKMEGVDTWYNEENRNSKYLYPNIEY